MSVSIHPGIVPTGLYEPYLKENPFLKFGMAAVGPFLTKPQNGALNQLWAVAVEREKLTNGAYYSPVGVKACKHQFVSDEEGAKALWEWTDREVSSERGDS
jgi:hypothetical protein